MVISNIFQLFQHKMKWFDCFHSWRIIGVVWYHSEFEWMLAFFHVNRIPYLLSTHLSNGNKNPCDIPLNPDWVIGIFLMISFDPYTIR